MGRWRDSSIRPLLRRLAPPALKQMRRELTWRRQGRPAPPPDSVKRRLLRRHAKAHGLRVFIETGTYDGGTVQALSPRFRELHSIELSSERYEKARLRLAPQTNVKLWQGDSGAVLPQVLESVREPALFWLDGHYSGVNSGRGELDTPIRLELEHIARHPWRASHFIVVDDARLFNGTNDYPTLDQLRGEARELGFPHMAIEDDMIVLSASSHHG